MFNIFKIFSKNTPTPPKGKLPFQVDVHTHILPGIDDGAKTMEASVELIQKLQSLGIKKIIATSHITYGSFPNDKEIISRTYNTLTEHLKEKGIDIDIEYSAEYRLDTLFDKMHDEKMLMPFAGNHILIENSFIQPYLRMNDLIFQMQTEGYSPIIAHVERYTYYGHNRDKVIEFRDQGALIQVNMLSFTGYYGSSAKEFAKWLLQEKLIDLLGTDVHNIRQLNYLEEYMKSKSYGKIYPLLLENDLQNDLLLNN